MTVRIEVTQEQKIILDGNYQVITEVTYSNNISSAIFVCNTETKAFSHVAYPYDIVTYPEGYEESVNTGASFYRINAFSSDFSDIATAINFSSYTLTRIQWLVNQYTADIDSFVGKLNYIFTG